MKKNKCINNRNILIAVIILLAVSLLILLCIPRDSIGISSPASTDPTALNTQGTQEELRLPDLLSTAKAIKSNLLSALKYLKQNKLDKARQKLDTALKDIIAVQTYLKENPFLASLIPQSKNITEFLDSANMAVSEILLPAIDLLEANPISKFSTGDGFNVMLLAEYLDFAESVMPKLERLANAVAAVDFSLLDSEGKILEYMEPVTNILEIYHEDPAIFSIIKSMLGTQEDRIYLIAVQNPSEIRASGGFPGFLGTLHIENGIMTVGEFKSVSNFLQKQTPNNIQITKEEWALFNYLSGVQNPRDSDLCPDYERVAHIWASSYEQMHNKPLDGVISITPHLVQRLLAATDERIELSDGWTLTGDNAVKVLIHDIYFKYFTSQNPHPNRKPISDQLFADAAQATMKKLTGNISASDLTVYFSVMKDSFADRTLMLWMKDEKEQAFVINRGWSGGLNRDPQNPEAGVYFNCVTASKMGWFLLMDTQMGERTKNADGSYTYPITVTFTNNITQEEIVTAGRYISGGLWGSMQSVAYFFAPAGGTVDNFTASNGQDIPIKTYNGMTLGFMDVFLLRPNTPITVTYTVTTAPGVDTPLVFSKTPTGQQS